MDQINHIGRPCDSELRFCGAAQRFLDTTALGRTSWAGLADARHRSSPLSSCLGEQMAAARTEATSPPSVPSLRPLGDEPWEGSWWEETMVDGSGWCGCTVVFVSSGYKLDRTQLGRAGSAWLGLALRLDLWGVVLDSGLGMQTQWRSQTVVQYGGMSEVYLAPFLTECVCEWLCVCVCVCPQR